MPTRVYVDMVGDLVHPGHVALLEAARSLGEELVVGLLSDESAAACKRRPVMTLEERVGVVAASRHVDVVARTSDLSTTALNERIRAREDLTESRSRPSSSAGP